MPTEPQQVGFIGLGNMGAPMVSNLVAAGRAVRAFDLSVDARDRARAAGATVTDSAAGTTSAESIILMLPNSDVVEAVVAEIQPSLKPGSLLIDMSSSEPFRTRRLAEELGRAGIRLIDAPVSGGVAGATAGALTIMAGGSTADIDAATPLLGVLGRVVRAGDVGAGHAIKALNNLLSATHLWATGEAMAMGERFGLEPQTMLDVINTSSGRSGSTQNKWPRFVLPGTYDSGFGLRLMLKDMRIAVQLAVQLGLSTGLGGEAAEHWSAAADDLAPDADHTMVAAWIRDHDNTTPRQNRDRP